MNVKTLVPLVDLGTVKPEYRGIWSPQYDDELIQRFIHQFFQENAAVYAERYQATEHWKNLVRRAQKHFAIDSPQPRILDIGSGAGNSVFPLLDLYPQADIIATDLSVPLLKMLKDELDRKYADRSCQVMQLNAEQLIFADDQFDLVCGGSILHHLFHPEKTIAECYRILKPGGAAIFFEPFEVGNQILALVFQQLLEMNKRRLIGVATRTPPASANWHSLSGIWHWLRWAKNWVLPVRLRRPIPPRIVRFFQDACTEYRLRKGREHDEVVLQHFEDKVLFTRSFFEEQAQAAGFADVVIESISASEQQFTMQTHVMLRLGPALPEAALPAWAWDYPAQMDQHFSSELMPDLMCEGLVVFRKPAAQASANRAA